MLERENGTLRREIADLKKAQEEKVEKVSRTYEGLLSKMEEEIRHGQVTISELRGKLTLNMVDAILFDTGMHPSIQTDPPGRIGGLS